MTIRPVLFAAALLAAPAAFAQHDSKPDPQPANVIQRQQELINREAMSNAKAMQLGDRQAWLNSLANQAKLHARLKEAWQSIGLSPQAAKTIADAYDPELASQMHHTSLRGKSDQEVAALLQSALAARHYLVANQLLIDYQRAKLSLPELASSDASHVLSGR